MGEFVSELRSLLGATVFRRVVRQVVRNDCLGLAGQLAYFILLSLFPFVMFLVAVAGLVTSDPQSSIKVLAENLQVFLPRDAVNILESYIDRTLQSTTAGVLTFGILATLWSASAGSDAIIKAANRSYGLEETRPTWKVWGISFLMVGGHILMATAVVLVLFSVGERTQNLTGLSHIVLEAWNLLRWVFAFLAVNFALALLYYAAPAARVPFKWITPGGFAATVLIGLSGAILNFYVSDFGRYDQIYGQLGAVIVMMLWLYLTGFMVLVGVEINAVLARLAEERKGVEIVQPEDPGKDPERDRA